MWWYGVCAVSLRDIVTVCSRDLIVIHFRVVPLCILVSYGAYLVVWDFCLDLVSFLWFLLLLGAPVENSLGMVFHFVNLLELVWVFLHDRQPRRYFMVRYLCCFWILSMMGWWFCSIPVSINLVVLALRVALLNILSIALRASLWESPSVTFGIFGSGLRRHELSPVLHEWLCANFLGKNSTV